jgi:hypothetical protein
MRPSQGIRDIGQHAVERLSLSVLDVAVLIPIAPNATVGCFVHDIPKDVDVPVSSHFPLYALSQKLVLPWLVVPKQPQRQPGARVVAILSRPDQHVAIVLIETVRNSPLPNKVHPLPYQRLAFIRLVLTPVELQQLNEVEQFLEAVQIALVRVVSGPYIIAKEEIV